MFRCLLLCFTVLIIVSNSFASNDNFYYLEGDSVFLYPAEDKIVVGFNGDYMGDLSDVFIDYPQLNDTIEPNQFDTAFFVLGIEPETNINDLLDSLNQDQRIKLAQNVYLNAEGGEVVFGNKITVHVSNTIEQTYYDSLLGQYGLIQYGFDDTKPAVRYLKTDSSSILNVLDIANNLYEDNEILFAHPRFRCDFEKFYFPDDSLFIHQWNYWNPNIYVDEYFDEHQGKDINATTAWEIMNSKGNENVIVAVLDDALTAHPDINPNSLLQTVDVYDDDYDCTMYYNDEDAHGFAVTGLIIADHNNIGIAGLVPDCKLLFYKIVHDNGETFADYEKIASAFRKAAESGANVISCSWGCYFCAENETLNDAIKDVTDPSRMGYACSIFFAAGNCWYCPVAYPAKLPEVISVGATDSLDTRWYYSCSGDSLDVMAPSGNIEHASETYEGLLSLGSILTIDRPTDSGYNNRLYGGDYMPFCHCASLESGVLTPESIGYEYTCNFGGTSAACPQVAGIAAMIMSKRPDLIDSNYLVYDIIKYSAEDQVGPSTGYIADTPGYDTNYGWGRVNALRALLAVSRGDANNDGNIDMLDVTYIIDYCYKGGDPPTPDILMGDASGNALVNILDVTYIVNYLYEGGPPPPISFEYGD